MLKAEAPLPVDPLFWTVPPWHIVNAGGLCLSCGQLGALVVEPLALAGRRGAEWIAAADVVAVAVSDDRAELLSPGGTSCQVGGCGSEPPDPRVALLDGLAGECGGALLDHLGQPAQRLSDVGRHRSIGITWSPRPTRQPTKSAAQRPRPGPS